MTAPMRNIAWDNKSGHNQSSVMLIWGQLSMALELVRVCVQMKD